MSDQERLLQLLELWSSPQSWQVVADACEQHRQARQATDDLRSDREFRQQAGEEAYRDLLRLELENVEMMRQAMIQTAATVAELQVLLQRLHPELLGVYGPAALLPDCYPPMQRAERVAAVRAGVLAALQQPFNAVQQPFNARDERNRFCYEQMAAGNSLQQIKNQVNKRREWEPLETLQGVSKAAKNWADKHALPWPVAR